MSNMLNDRSQPEATGPVSSEPEAPQQTSWLSQIPEDLRDEPSLQDFNSIGDVAKSYVSAQKMLGGSIRIPGPDASDEVKSAFYNRLQEMPNVIKLPETEQEKQEFYGRLGRPATPDGYDIRIEEGLQVNEDLVNDYKQWAHSAGLTGEQANYLISQKIEQEKVELAERQAYQQHANDLLKESWGKEYETRLNAANAVLAKFKEKYPDDVAMLQQQAGNNPVLAMVLAEHGKLMADSGLISGVTKASFENPTPDEALITISEIRKNPNHPYNNPSDPAHKSAKQRVQDLYNIAYPG